MYFEVLPRECFNCITALYSGLLEDGVEAIKTVQHAAFQLCKVQKHSFGTTNPSTGRGSLRLAYLFFFRHFGMIKCPTVGSHILHPNNGVFQAIVVLGTHPVYLNPSAHSAVKTLA